MSGHAAFRRYLRRGTYFLCTVAAGYAVWLYCARG